MSIKDLQAELLADHKKKLESLTIIAFEADKNKFPDIYELAIKQAPGHKMMVDYLENNQL